MRPCQVDHVKIIPHACSIGRIIIIAEHVQRGPAANGHLRHIGHQIVGHAMRVLADLAAGMGANRVEIAQDRHVRHAA